MAFGQQSGPPASPKQLQHLLALLQRDGHDGFRDARGPLGFTQRQAAGKFTRAEAQSFIDELEAGELLDAGEPLGGPPTVQATTAPVQGTGVAGEEPPREPGTGRGRRSPSAGDAPSLRHVASDHLAAELQRRGWIVMAP